MRRKPLLSCRVSRYNNIDGLRFEGSGVICAVAAPVGSPLLEPLADGESWYVEIVKVRYDDLPIHVERDRILAEQRNEPYDPERGMEGGEPVRWASADEKALWIATYAAHLARADLADDGADRNARRAADRAVDYIRHSPPVDYPRRRT